MNETAIVTLAIGEQHLAFWRKYCERGWRVYAQRCGYDLVPITTPLDTSPRAAARSPAWQKCLVLSQEFSARYSQIISLDCDIVINADEAPKITGYVAPAEIGGVISGSHIHPDLRIHLLSRLRNQRYDYESAPRSWQEDQVLYYERYGLRPIDVGLVQTGVLVASPEHHRKLFEAVYNAPCIDDEHRTYEQVPLSHAILSSGQFRQIDTRFNSVFYESMLVHYPYLLDEKLPHRDLVTSCAVQTEFANNFFLHFAYDRDFARYLAPKKVTLSDDRF